MRLQAKSGYKVTGDEIREHQIATGNTEFILSRPIQFWQRMIRDNQPDRDAILAKKYRPSQLPYIESEMRRLGLLEETVH